MSDHHLKFSANLDRDQLLASQKKSELSCHVSIKPNVITGDESGIATTANICLLFDCSYSMAGNKLNTAVKTAKMIIDILHERHKISLLAFNSRSHVIFKNAVPTAEEKNEIKNKVDRITHHLGGSTNMAAGIKSAIKILSESEADADVIVLLSDGEADSAERAQKVAEEASEKGIQIHAVGMGESYNAEQLLNLAAPSNGAVFGDTEGDKINSIFYDIINRIDQIFASKVKLEFDFDKGVQLKRVFKTRPERALYDSLSIDRNRNLALRVGNIESNKTYEFLLQIEADQHDVGTLELIKARLQYEVNHLGIIKQQVQEIILTVEYIQSDALETVTSDSFSNVIKRATMVQLSDDLAQACSKSDNAGALDAIDKLQQQYGDETNSALQQHLDSMKIKLESGHKVSDKERNDFLLASANAAPSDPPKVKAPPKVVAPVKVIAPPKAVVPEKVKAPPKNEVLPDANLYEFILVDPGEETIRLLREIRNATDMGIPEIADIIKSRNSRITSFKNKTDATKFQRKLVKIGATVKIQTSGGMPDK